MNTKSFIFFTRILARAQISSLTSESFFIEVLSVTILETTKTGYDLNGTALKFYRSQFWRLQKPWNVISLTNKGFIGHNFGDYKNQLLQRLEYELVLSVTILETTKTPRGEYCCVCRFIGHNFGDYKNRVRLLL